MAVGVHRPTQVVLAVEDDEVVVSHPLELDRGTDPAEAGADDDHIELLLGHVPTVPEVPVTDEMPRLLVDGASSLGGRRCHADHVVVALIPSLLRRVDDEYPEV